VAIGTAAAHVRGANDREPRALVFYRVTCSTTQLAGPALARLGEAYPGHVVGVGQDPPEALASFAAEHGWSFPQVPDVAPYEASDAYGVVTAPTVIVVDADDRVAALAEGWDRDAMNAASSTLARLLGVPAATLSVDGDGMPEFQPG
jgi:peroxiredoxin